MSKKIYILLIVFVFFGLSTINAQYFGGSGGGYDTAKITPSTCAYTIDYSLLFYTGGNGGGYDTTQISKIACPVTVFSEYFIYAGGNGGGYDTAQISKITCPVTINAEYFIYAGGDGGGYDTAQISKTSCPAPQSTNFYLGSPITVGSSLGIMTNTTANQTGPYILAAANNYSIVKGDCVSLTTTGSGATAYTWTQSVGSDITSTNLQNTTAKPTQNTVYTVTATGATPGCRNTSSVLVKIIDNGATSISYPSSVCNSQSTNQYQYPVLAGLTNGVYSISPATGMTIDTKTGAIKTYSATTQTYVVTYTYGSTCSSTTTASITITNNCATNAGVVTYTNMYTGGLSNAVVSSNYTNTAAACAENPIIVNKIFAGGLSDNVASVNYLNAQTCPSNIDITTLIYAGGLSNNVVSNNSLLLQACTYPVGDNFYLGGTGMGYNLALKTPTSGAVTGTTVAVSADQTICPGTPITLTATGATNFTWSPATNLTSTIIANPVATPLTTTTYTVIGTGGVGCINTAKVTVTVLQDSYTQVSYGAYNFDETDMGLKKVNYILGPLTGSFSASPAGLSYNQTNGAFTPGLSTSQAYVINYNYTKGTCNYNFPVNINITTLPPSITYPSPSIFYINYAGTTATPTNTGGRAIAYEALDALPTGLSINASTGVISGTAVSLVEGATVRIRAYNLNKAGAINYSDVFTMNISVRKPIISSTTSSVTSMSATYGTASTSKAINVSGQYIIQNVLITPPSAFEVSTNASSGFANTLSLTQSGGNLASNFYIRLKSNAGVGNFSGTVVLSSDAADNLSIPIVTSNVAAAPITVTAAYFQKYYGSNISLGTGNTNFTTAGLVNGETIGSVTLTATGGTAANDVPGLYTITPTAATGGTFSPTNYNITYAAGQFEVLYSLYNFQMTGNTSNWVQGKVPIPKIATGAVSSITFTTATYTSNISTNYSNITQRGACWNTSANPTISNSKVVDGATTTGAMTSSLTGLTPGSTYYVRTFITVGSFTYYGPNVKFKTPARDGLTQATAGTSGYQLKTDFPAYTSGWYWIKSATMPNALQMYVDMTLDGGGYDFYFITAGPSVSTVTETNGGTALGLDLVMPRSKNHWYAMSNAVLAAITANKTGGASYASFFTTVYGVYRTTSTVSGGNYTSYIMRSSAYGGTNNAPDWRVKDGGKWWLRDNTYGEPNGDYGLNGLLGGGGFANPYAGADMGFNDLTSNYATGNYYMVSTNAKP